MQPENLTCQGKHRQLGRLQRLRMPCDTEIVLIVTCATSSMIQRFQGFAYSLGCQHGGAAAWKHVVLVPSGCILLSQLEVFNSRDDWHIVVSWPSRWASQLDVVSSKMTPVTPHNCPAATTAQQSTSRSHAPSTPHT